MIDTYCLLSQGEGTVAASCKATVYTAVKSPEVFRGEVGWVLERRPPGKEGKKEGRNAANTTQTGCRTEHHETRQEHTHAAV